MIKTFRIIGPRIRSRPEDTLGRLQNLPTSIASINLFERQSYRHLHHGEPVQP